MTRLLSGSHENDAQSFDLSTQHLVDAAWAALVNDSAHGVCLIKPDGSVAAASSAWLRDIGRSTEGEPPARITDALPASVASELLSHTADCRRSGRPVTVDTVIDGTRCLIALRPTGPAGEQAPVLTTWVRRPPEDHPALRDALPASAEDDTGPLSKLTSRELDVLRLIGYGLSTADIAKVLHRSVKTIEWHRVALGNKLGVTNRVELARIAIRTGLTGLGPLPEGIPNGSENGKKQPEAASA